MDGDTRPLPEVALGPHDPYWDFVRAVAMAQLTEWLPAKPGQVLDLSGPCPTSAAVVAGAGHRVVRLASSTPGGQLDDAPTVVGDPQLLDCFAPGAFDAVVAEDRALSRCLATEETMRALYALLRPGGRVLLSVDSLLYGMARLAQQNRWAHLADAATAELVLVGEPSGRVSRCFGVDELAELVEGAGLTLEWIRPRTVLAADTVRRAGGGQAGMRELVRSELRLAAEREGEAHGVQLVATAYRPH